MTYQPCCLVPCCQGKLGKLAKQLTRPTVCTVHFVSSYLVLILLLLLVGLLVALLPLGLLVAQLVVDQVVEGDDGADEGGRVDDEHLVVGVDVDRLDKVRVGQVGQQVEDVLQLVGDLVVHGQLPVDDLLGAIQ